MSQRTQVPIVERTLDVWFADDDPAVQRIHRDSWSRFNWYVRLANTQMRELPDSEIAKLQDEVIALQRSLFRHVSPDEMALRELLEFQEQVRKYLVEFVDGGDAYFPSFEVAIWVTHHEREEEAHRESDRLAAAKGYHRLAIVQGRIQTVPCTMPNKRMIPANRTPSVSIEYVLPNQQDGLLYQLAVLLGEYGHQLMRCSSKSCRAIFLQQRGTKKYCDRKCQSRTATQKIRQRATKKRNPRKNTSQKPKLGSSRSR